MGVVPTEYYLLDPPTSQLTQYKVLEVDEFTTHLQEDEAKKVAVELPNQIVQEITNYNQSHSDKPLFVRAIRETETVERVLVLKGIVISYEPGSSAKRYFIGLGSGKAYCTVQCQFFDKKTGRQVLKANFEGEISGGLFGGGAKGSSKGVIEAIINYFKRQSY